MAINPVSFTERVVGDFLKYQATAYAFADPALHAQLRELLSLERTRQTPLMKGPYISLSRSFRMGQSVKSLVSEGLLHPFMENLVPFQSVYAHQEKAIRSVQTRQTTLVSTGTGSGKTECFLYPIISRCLELRDEDAGPGIVAVIVYPMNALAEDQLGRLRDMLAGTGITFGMYVGKTPERTADVPNEHLPAGSSRADYLARLERARRERRRATIHPPEECVSREQMRTPGMQPRILLTNVKQLELLLTRQSDVGLFEGARFEFLVFDEAHTYGGAAGAETACLIRRLRAFCGKDAGQVAHIATSATLANPVHGLEGARAFASRFFGVPRDNVVLVSEEYEPDQWDRQRHMPSPLPGDPSVHLKNVLEAIDAGDEAGRMVRSVVQAMIGARIDAACWQESLYDLLARNELCYQISEALCRPHALAELVAQLSDRVGRPVSEEEVLVWLALGAASSKNGRPMLRPVIHVFVRGVGGAVVAFPEEAPGPKLWLSAEDHEAAAEEDRLMRLPVMTCNTCGQHYFVHHVRDLTVGAKGLGGGDAVDNRRVWPSLGSEQGGNRVVLLDRLALSDEDSEGEEGSWASHVHEVFMCRYCGALHPGDRTRCDACGRRGTLVRLFAVRQKDDHPGYLTSCLACKARGRFESGAPREPARPVRAVTVSDIHVLAQNMIHCSDRRRLLVFADNRQEAAFQAGWMKDHARRFRLRSLMYDRIVQGPISVDDLVTHLDRLLNADDEMSRSLIPEVWSTFRKTPEGVDHFQQRRYFLRIAVLREIATAARQRVGLEPWGRIRIDYHGLAPELPFIREWSDILGLAPEDLVEGIGSLLDNYRRRMCLLDREGQVFSTYWRDGDTEIQRGYLPLMPGVPTGLKLAREPSDNFNRVVQWLSACGDTIVKQAARAWGVPSDQLGEFAEQLWELLTGEVKILAPVTFTVAGTGKVLAGCSGVYQIDADMLRISPNNGVWRCRRCRRSQVRSTPGGHCLGWHCKGTISFELPDPDNYDLTAIDQKFAMIRPEEHSAQVPAEKREQLENLFKGQGDALNTLVCTPTLELGIDIGSLDTVLMRNIPPSPANYWQRVGRAGRRHRLAVNIAYARDVDHDRAYFAEPLKLLEGLVEPPRFNMRNELMIAKHVHAAVLTKLHQLTATSSHVSPDERVKLADALRAAFPTRVGDYLFDERGHVRTEDFDLSTFTEIVSEYEPVLSEHVNTAFGENWPEQDSVVVTGDALRKVVLEMPERLGDVIHTLKKRLDWARGRMQYLDNLRRRQGTLECDDDALYKRCDALVKRYKGIQSRRRSQSEGYDDTNTYAVLATEGFLPGYGLETGYIMGTAILPFTVEGRDFGLPRPPSLALREYVPGNLIYANSHRFVARRFHFEPEDPTLFQVDMEHESVIEVGTPTRGAVAALGAASLKAVPICDVDLVHRSNISDEEEYRFQLPVAVYGYETGRHGTGRRFTWGNRELTLRHGVHMRLVNVGPASRVRSGELGYPVSLITGQSRSPLASSAELRQFSESHLDRYGAYVEQVGLYADIVADALCLPNVANREEAYSVLETLRVGMSRVLEMEREDLEVLVVGCSGSDEVNGILYDPMPGGSGLLDQACERWPEVVRAALEVVERCPSRCARSCPDCLQTFRNAFYHRNLDRSKAAEVMRACGTLLTSLHEIPERLPSESPKGKAVPVNPTETKLRHLLQRAGFPEPKWQYEIRLGRPVGSTFPDCFFPGEDEYELGTCIYLDGLSEHIHGNPATAAKDRDIRDELRSRGYEVVEITATELDDCDAMARHFYRLARLLMGRESARRIRSDQSWFAG